ncbi:MAG: RNA methyltransferase, partial [Clostridia bacterium]|nr:RNA methyltransferase [Clostridia bacterium]
DPSNLGAASRTAEALGFSGIILSSQSVNPYSPKSLRASMGALLRLPIIVTDDFLGTIKEYKNGGFTVSGTVVDTTATPINKVAFGENEIAIIGNEASGMTDGAKALCDRLLTIPMAGRAESLNAGVAAAIVMWEMCR